MIAWRSWTAALVTAGLAACASSAALAGPVYHPPGSNLTYGDVTHGQRVQSASSNPAAAAADRARREDGAIRGVIVSTSAGIEYGTGQFLVLAVAAGVFALAGALRLARFLVEKGESQQTLDGEDGH